MATVYIQFGPGDDGTLGLEQLLRRAQDWAHEGVVLLRRKRVKIVLAHPHQAPALRSILERLGAERVLMVDDGPGSGQEGACTCG